MIFLNGCLCVQEKDWNAAPPITLSGREREKKWFQLNSCGAHEHINRQAAFEVIKFSQRTPPWDDTSDQVLEQNDFRKNADHLITYGDRS